jgi:dolichyl-phosphate beta-glucosyltransferase
MSPVSISRSTFTPHHRRSAVDLEIIVPAFNEERRLGRTLTEIRAHLAGDPRLTARIVIVDNGSADRTAELVDRLDLVALGTPSENVEVTVIGCSRGGKGAAIRRGMLSSSARWIGFCDADLATPATDITRAVAALREGFDVVVGSRRCAGAEYAQAQTTLRRMGGFAFRVSTRRLAGNVRDTQCGFKFFRGAAARALFAGTISAGFSFDVELIARARLLRLSVAELPVHWTDQPGSSLSPWRDGRRIVAELSSLRRLYPTLPSDHAVVVLP